MASWGSCDFGQLQRLREKVQKLAQADMQTFCEEASREMAARLLALVIPRTPVGKRAGRVGYMGGTLRRGWTAKTEAEAQSGQGRGSAGAAYAQSLAVTKSGDSYQITVINPVQYASYVEFGHRQKPGRYVPQLGKRLKKAWVPGQYMLTISEKQLQDWLPGHLERRLNELFAEVFRVDG